MVQHVLEGHMIQLIEKTEQMVAELKEENQNIVANQDRSIKKLEERFLAVEKFITSGVEIPDVVEAGGGTPAARLPFAENVQSLKEAITRRSIKKLEERFLAVEKFITSGVEIPDVVEADGGTPATRLPFAENVQSLEEAITCCSIALDEIRLRQDVLDVKTTNGTCTWKIPEVRRRYRDAVERRTTSLYSPPFYTSPHGYRKQVCGNGVGSVKQLQL